jgi:hypothetical protein
VAPLVTWTREHRDEIATARLDHDATRAAGSALTPG